MTTPEMILSISAILFVYFAVRWAFVWGHSTGYAEGYRAARLKHRAALAPRRPDWCDRAGETGEELDGTVDDHLAGIFATDHEGRTK